MSQSNLPKARLNQIARRKLVQLGIPSAQKRDSEDLEAEIPSLQGRVNNPFNGIPISRARFRVEGHAHAVFVDPPLLVPLAPISFYEFQTALDFLNAIGAALDARADALKRVAKRLHAAGLEFRVDVERGTLVSRVELNPTLGTIILEGDASAIYAIELVASTTGKQRAPIPIPRTQVDFAMLADRTTLTLTLSRIAEQALASGAAPARASQAPAISVQAKSPFEPMRPAVVAESGDLVLTLSTADLSPAPPEPKAAEVGFASGAAVPAAAPAVAVQESAAEAAAKILAARASGVAPTPKTAPPAAKVPTSSSTPAIAPARAPSTPPAPKIEVKEKVAGKRIEPVPVPGSLTLKLLSEKVGDSALVGAGVTVVRDLEVGGKRVRFEAKQVDGITFAGRVLIDGQQQWQDRFVLDAFPGVEAFVRLLLGATEEAEAAEEAALGDGLHPQPGEIWSLRVVVEREEGDEIRYVGLNADGQPYGAPRILAKAHFMDAFQEHAGGYRLMVKVLSATAENITYVRLDARKQPVDKPKTLPYLGFIGQFVRE